MAKDRDGDLSREIQAHLDLEAEERIADGLSPRDAQNAARRAFGNVLRIREEARSVWVAPWIDRTAQDLRHAARRLRRAPGFTIAAVGILTVGIALNLALFQLLNVAALAPLAVADVDTLVRFDRVTKRFSANGLPYPATQFIRDHNDVLAAVLTSHASDAVWGDDPNVRVKALYVSANWFSELGYGAAIGRVFEPNDEKADAEPIVVVSHDFWRERLQSQPVAGQTVRINERPAVVVGVAPEGFPDLELDDPQIWLMARQIEYFNPAIPFVDDWSAHNTRLYGRLKPGVSLAAASDGLRGTIEELARVRPAEFEADEVLMPYSGRDRFRSPRDRDELLRVALLAGGVTLLVLFVACANLTSLVLGRGVGRLRELGLCAALGATRWRLFRQQLVESAVFAALAAVAGLLVGHAIATLVARFWLPPFIDLGVDWRVAAATCGLAFLVTAVVGAVPAWLMGRRDFAASLKDGGHQLSAGVVRGRFRLVSIASQAAGCCVLLIVAGTTVQGLDSVLRPNFGFAVDRVAALDPSLGRYGIEGEAARAFWAETTRLLAAAPEIERLALASTAPLAGSAGRSTYNDAPRLSVTGTIVEAAFFDVLGIAIVRGRNFEAGDNPGSVAIVSRRLAIEMYGTIDAVGLGFPRSNPSRTIVGVADDASLVHVSATNVAEWYSPIGPREYSRLVLLARARSTADRLLVPLRDAARAADRRVLPRTWLPATDLAERVRGRGAIALAANGIGLTALSLAGFGIFGVVACAASLRRQEIGIRRALGARGGSIVLLFLRQLVTPLALGLVLGAAAGTTGAGLLEGDPFYMPAVDARVAMTALAVFVVTAAAAAIVPALRALRVDPLVAIRHD